VPRRRGHYSAAADARVKPDMTFAGPSQCVVRAALLGNLRKRRAEERSVIRHIAARRGG